MSGAQYRGFLDQSSWFEGAPERVIDKLQHAASVKQYAGNSYVWSLGEANTHVFGILSGRVRISVASETGQEFAVIDRERGAWLGDPCLVTDQGRAAEARTLVPTELLLLPRAVMLEVGEEWPQLYRNLYRDNVTNTRGLYEIVAFIMFYPLQARVAGRVLLLVEEHGQEVEDGILIDIRLSQNDFARLAMGSRQRVNRIFREWSRQGLVETRGDHLLIRDPEGLEKLVVPFE